MLKAGFSVLFKIKLNFSRNVIFGVLGQNISRTTGSDCMISSEVIYINKMCVLNELDFHLKAESFQTSNTKKFIFLYRGSVTMHCMTRKN